MLQNSSQFLGYICGYIYGQILDYYWDQTFRIILDQFQLNIRPNFWETFPKNSYLIFLTTSVHDRSLNPIGKISGQTCDTILTRGDYFDRHFIVFPCIFCQYDFLPLYKICFIENIGA